MAKSGRKSPFSVLLRRLWRVSAESSKLSAPPTDELLETSRSNLSRRDFIKSAGVGGLWLATAGLFDACSTPKDEKLPTRKTAPKTAIVGAGIAGLNAAYLLSKSGIRAEIYEASSRTGGRMFSVNNAMADGLTTEFGGEFIDSTHTEILSLVKEFGLQLMDKLGPDESSLKPEAFFFNDKMYSERQVVEEMKQLVPKIAADIEVLGDDFGFRNPAGAAAFDNLSLAEYFDQIGAKGWIREFLEVAYVTEYGLDTGDQSCINFLYLVSADLSGSRFDIFGDSDERYKVKGGNQSIPNALADKLKDQIHLGHRLTAISTKGKSYVLTFTTGGSTKDIDADVVLLTIPFSILREVDIKVELPDWKKKAIAELGYGMNTKVMVGTKSHPWRKLGYSGAVYSDEAFQLAWDNGQMQGTEAGGITLYSGGKKAIEAGKGTINEQVERLLPGYDKVFKGTKSVLNGKMSRMDWPNFQFTKGSYSAYKVGQWTTIAGAEFEPVGNIFFAGEHCSRDFQGFMEGGAETGKRAAEAILKHVSKDSKV